MPDPAKTDAAQSTAAPGIHLRRDLGLVQATALAITDMVGVGPFITIPLFLATMGGPQAMLGWLIGALLAFCDGLVWAELGAAMPKAGGSYHYLRRAYGADGAGRWLSFLAVWQIMFSAPLSMASGSIGFANYFGYLAPQLSAWHFFIVGREYSGITLVAILLPLLMVALLYRRIRTLGRVSVVLLAGVLAGCFWIVAAGLPHLSFARVFDFPPGAFRLNWVFWAGLGHATLYALYDYFGYYNVCYLGEEIRDPGRVIPRAIIFSIVAVGALYVLINISLLSVVPWREALESKFIAATFIEKLYGGAAASAMTLLILWIAFASIFSLLLGYSRIPYAAAADGNFFTVFSKLHAKGNFPHIALVTLGVTASIFGLFGLPEVIGSLVATRILVQYLPQVIGLFVLRFREPELVRPFRMWLYPVPGIISILGWLFVLSTSAPKALYFAVAVFLLGSATYFFRERYRADSPASR
jgi:amino acid transporter